ncbi:hypothetical protein CLF_112283 [Clonorchis sinensis]|uniref:Uncharacterized protein n=1 Tax=Clonorchis sinensis TaxID=79923 RepID=G7YME7_CLOSI|nr:hypothetical protein CLF_112283 [Clonorchis sinensis]
MYTIFKFLDDGQFANGCEEWFLDERTSCRRTFDDYEAIELALINKEGMPTKAITHSVAVIKQFGAYSEAVRFRAVLNSSDGTSDTEPQTYFRLHYGVRESTFKEAPHSQKTQLPTLSHFGAVEPQVLKDLEDLRASPHNMEHEMSSFRTIQPIAHLLNPDTTCDPANVEKASISVDTITVEICQCTKCPAILTAQCMFGTTYTARWLRKLKPSMCCPIIMQFLDEDDAARPLISQAPLSFAEKFRTIKVKAARTRMQQKLTKKPLPTPHNSVTGSYQSRPSSTHQSMRIMTFDITQSQMSYAPTSPSNLASRNTVDTCDHSS